MATWRGMPLSGSVRLPLKYVFAPEAAILSLAKNFLDKNAFLDEL
jgi:hypothetical protein